MPNYLLVDTCAIIDYINGRSSELSGLLDNGTHLFVNSIIEMELLQGARSKNELQVIKKKLNSFRLLTMHQAIFDLATQYICDYNLSHSLTLPDAVIGATAIFYKIPLFTYNRKDFKFLPHIQLG